MERKLLVKVVVVSAASVVLTLLVIVGVAWAADIFTVDKDGTVRLVITDAGNVEIGVANPGARLIVGGVSTGDRGFEVLGTVGNSHIPYLDGEIYLSTDISAGATGTGDLNFRTYDGTSHLTKVIIKGTTGSVGIGTSNPATSAKLDIASTTGAILIPRMSTVNRDALTPANGMIVYNTTTNAFNFYENGAWVTRN